MPVKVEQEEQEDTLPQISAACPTSEMTRQSAGPRIEQ